MSNLNTLITNKESLVSLETIYDWKLIREAVDTCYQLGHRCDLSSREAYLEWVAEWKETYAELTILIRRLKLYRKLKNANSTYEYVKFVPTKWWLSIYDFHAYNEYRLTRAINELGSLATSMIELRTTMKSASYRKKMLDIAAKAA